VSVLDLSDRAARRVLTRVDVAPETLTADQLRGKVLFHNASSSRISQLDWIACATCHLGGGGDGTTWRTPDGPRQTMPLWELEGTAPFHASATRDEVQDFERDIEELMAGSGLAPGAVRAELGAPNGGLSDDLDALAAYVLGGIRVPTAPAVDFGQASVGRTLFGELGCASCHGGPLWTSSPLPGPVGSLGSTAEVAVVGVPAGLPAVCCAPAAVSAHPPRPRSSRPCATWAPAPPSMTPSARTASTCQRSSDCMRLRHTSTMARRRPWPTYWPTSFTGAGPW